MPPIKGRHIENRTIPSNCSYLKNYKNYSKDHNNPLRFPAEKLRGKFPAIVSKFHRTGVVLLPVLTLSVNLPTIYPKQE